jgi:hypothetical protein
LRYGHKKTPPKFGGADVEENLQLLMKKRILLGNGLFLYLIFAKSNLKDSWPSYTFSGFVPPRLAAQIRKSGV